MTILVTSNSKPRVPKLLRKSASKKLHLWRKLRSSPDDVSLQCRYHSCVLEWRQLIKSAQASAEVKIIDANNLGAFHRFVNKRIGNRSSIGAIVDGNSRFVTTPQKKQICSTAIFHLSVSQDNGILPNCQNVNLQCILEDMTFESVDVLRSINNVGNCSVYKPLLTPKILPVNFPFVVPPV